MLRDKVVSLKQVILVARNLANVGNVAGALAECEENLSDASAPLYYWVLYNAALYSLNLGDTSKFERFSFEFLSAAVVEHASYHVGRVQMLRSRIEARLSSGHGPAEARQLLDISGTESDLVLVQKTYPEILNSKELPLTFSADWLWPVSRQTNDRLNAVVISEVHYMEREARGRKISPLYIDEVEDAEYFSFNGECAVIKDGRFFDGLFVSPSLYRQYQVVRRTVGTPLALGGTAVVISDRFSGDNYCHWTYDWLTRATTASRLVRPINWICARVKGTNFQKSHLQHTSLNSATLLADGGLCWYKFKSVLTLGNKQIDRLHPALWGNELILKDLREQCVRRPLKKGYVATKRIYISRSDANGRRTVVNEAVLIEALERIGYSTVVLSGLSLPEQIQIFSEAEVVIATHGAGLTNIVYMRPETKVIELLNIRYGTSAYLRVANSLALDYRYMACRTSVEENIPESLILHTNSFVDTNLWVDVPLLLHHLANN